MYSLDAEGIQQAKFKAEVLSVVYPEVSDNGLISGMGSINSGNYDRAIAVLEKATQQIQLILNGLKRLNN